MQMAQSINLAGNVDSEEIESVTNTVQNELFGSDEDQRVDDNIGEETDVDSTQLCRSQTPTQNLFVGNTIFAKISRVSQKLLKFIGMMLSMCTVGCLTEDSSHLLRVVVIAFTALDSYLFAHVLYFLHVSRQIWRMPYYYCTIHTCFIVLESFDISRRFCHRNISRMFTYHVPEMHIETMLWVRPLVSLFFAIMVSCVLLTLANFRDFAGMVIPIYTGYWSFWYTITTCVFHLMAQSDPNMLNVIFPDQRTTAEIHNLNRTITALTPSDQLSDVLQARENFIWQRSFYCLPAPESPNNSDYEQRADHNV